MVVVGTTIAIAALGPGADAQTYERAGAPPTGVGRDVETLLASEAEPELPDWVLASGSWLADAIPDLDAEPAPPEPKPKPPAKKKEKKPSPIDIAIKTAKAQIGKPYRWGSLGPNSFDCSGLVNFAYGKAGIGLPRTSRGMYAALPRVKLSGLKRGDLVFSGWGRVTHVGIYLGDGLMVHSPQTGEQVKISPLRRNLIGAGRPVR